MDQIKNTMKSDRYSVKYKTFTVTIKGDYQSNIDNNDSAEKIFRGMLCDLDADQEHFMALFLDIKCRLLSAKVISSGGMSETIMDARILFRNALLAGASAVILSHNHLSGKTDPSAHDSATTERFVTVGKEIGIPILDHLILGDDVYSFMEAGQILHPNQTNPLKYC